MDLSDASEKIPSDTTGDRSWDLPTSSAATLPQALTKLGVLRKFVAKRKKLRIGNSGADKMLAY